MILKKSYLKADINKIINLIFIMLKDILYFVSHLILMIYNEVKQEKSIQLMINDVVEQQKVENSSKS